MTSSGTVKTSLFKALFEYASEKVFTFLLIGCSFIVYHSSFHCNSSSEQEDAPSETVVDQRQQESTSLDSDERTNVTADASVCVYLHEHLTASEKEAISIARPIIQRFEGLRLNRYNDVGNHAIGYGHHLTGPNADVTAISRETAECLLNEDMREIVHFLDAIVTVPLEPYQLAALTDWVYNIGPGAARRSSLIEHLNQSQYSKIPQELNRWVHVGKNVSENLIHRREQEGRLFSTGSID